MSKAGKEPKVCGDPHPKRLNIVPRIKYGDLPILLWA